MAKICGIENVAFVGKDGTEVRGKRIHFTEAIAADRGVGEAGDKIFCPQQSLLRSSLRPQSASTLRCFTTKMAA